MSIYPTNEQTVKLGLTFFEQGKGFWDRIRIWGSLTEQRHRLGSGDVLVEVLIQELAGGDPGVASADWDHSAMAARCGW